MPVNMITIKDDELRQLVKKQLVQVNVPPEDAAIIADVLVFSDLRGVHSHGVIRVEHYVNRIRKGGINVSPRLEFRKIRPVAGFVDAQGSSGAVSMTFAMKHAIQIARKEGICIAGIGNNSHCGALAYYVQMALDDYMVSMVMGNTDSCVVPFGGSSSYLGSNPLAFGYPGDKESILLDMATSEVAFGKILYAREKKQDIPPGWAVDNEGRPCTDPDKARALLPFGGAKGYGINIMVEAFTGLLVSGIFGPYVTRMYGDLNKLRNVSNFILVIDPSLFSQGDDFLSSARQFMDGIRAVAPTPGLDHVMIPGEIERNRMKISLAEGISIPQSVYDFLAG